MREGRSPPTELGKMKVMRGRNVPGTVAQGGDLRQLWHHLDFGMPRSAGLFPSSLCRQESQSCCNLSLSPAWLTPNPASKSSQMGRDSKKRPPEHLLWEGAASDLKGKRTFGQSGSLRCLILLSFLSSCLSPGSCGQGGAGRLSTISFVCSGHPAALCLLP